MRGSICHLQIALARRRVRLIHRRYQARDYNTSAQRGRRLGTIAYMLNNDCGLSQREAAKIIGYSAAWTSTLIAQHSKFLAR